MYVTVARGMGAVHRPRGGRVLVAPRVYPRGIGAAPPVDSSDVLSCVGKICNNVRSIDNYLSQTAVADYWAKAPVDRATADLYGQAQSWCDGNTGTTIACGPGDAAAAASKWAGIYAASAADFAGTGGNTGGGGQTQTTTTGNGGQVSAAPSPVYALPPASSGPAVAPAPAPGSPQLSPQQGPGPTPISDAVPALSFLSAPTSVLGFSLPLWGWLAVAGGSLYLVSKGHR